MKSGKTYRLKESWGYLINRASRTIRKCLNQELSSRGFTIGGEQFAVLVHLWDRDGQTQQELADELSKDKTTMTRLINGIETIALIMRVRDKNDERRRRIFLTRKGRILMEELTAVAQEILISAQAGINEKDMAICKDVLSRVHETLSGRLRRRFEK